MVVAGGIEHSDSGRGRSFSWAPVTGMVEAAICDARGRAKSAPELAAAVLDAALSTVDDRPARREDINRLSVVALRSLMIELATRFGLTVQWLTHVCQECGEPFDVPIDLAALPVDAPIDNGAEADAETTLGRFRFRLPTADDQIAIASEADDRRAMRALLIRCLAENQDRNEAKWVDRLTDQDIEAISEALEAIALGAPWAAEARCPECGHSHAIPIDVTAWIFRLDDPIIDVHEIAATYGWSEDDILSLGRSRRLHYLSFIRRHNADFAEVR